MSSLVIMPPLMHICGGKLVGGSGAGGIRKEPLLMPCKLPDRLPPPCKWRLLEPRPIPIGGKVFD